MFVHYVLCCNCRRQLRVDECVIYCCSKLYVNQANHVQVITLAYPSADRRQWLRVNYGCDSAG